MIDKADGLACITLAFGVSKEFKDAARRTTRPTTTSAFMLLEKEDKPQPASQEAVRRGSTPRNNVYQAWGSFLRRPAVSVDEGNQRAERSSSTST